MFCCYERRQFEPQTSVSYLMSVLYRDELETITLQFLNIEKKTSWEAAFTSAKQKLGKSVVPAV